MKKIVRVVIEKEIEIELMPSLFGNMTEEEYIEEFSNTLWDIDSLEDVIQYAGRMVAEHGVGTYDGLGLVNYHYSTYPRVPDVKVKLLSEDIDAEIINE